MEGMTAIDLFESQFDVATKQLNGTLADMPESLWSAKLVPSTMSPIETVVHLTEATVACRKMLKGEEHDWGTYEAVSSDAQTCLDLLMAERNALREDVVSTGDPTHINEVMAYSPDHDFYHVGQLCALRVAQDPGFNPYSIYS